MCFDTDALPPDPARTGMGSGSDRTVLAADDDPLGAGQPVLQGRLAGPQGLEPAVGGAASRPRR